MALGNLSKTPEVRLMKFAFPDTKRAVNMPERSMPERSMPERSSWHEGGQKHVRVGALRYTLRIS
ncbi:hypothetical protein EFU19_17645 [Vibrio cholerae]|nr:hypothetical protein [Vibrio cholerae]